MNIKKKNKYKKNNHMKIVKNIFKGYRKVTYSVDFKNYYKVTVAKMILT